jgi:hypothetical protein
MYTRESVADILRRSFCEYLYIQESNTRVNRRKISTFEC